MNRNTDSRFANVPSISVSRSTFDRSCSCKTSFNVGDLIPFYVDEVLPGDTFNIKTSKVLRMPALLTPIMDNICLDTYYFFVPNRLVWSHWKELMGENTSSAWLPATTYSVPQVTSPPSTGWTSGSIADYMGIPIGVTDLSVNALPFRGYTLIVNEWFRSEALQDPANCPVDDTTVVGSNGTNYITDLCKGGAPFRVNKLFDYFTGALPAPQRGPDVEIPVADAADLPVFATADLHSKSQLPKKTGWTKGVYPLVLTGSNSAGNADQAAALRLTNNVVSAADPTTDFGLDMYQHAAPLNLWAVQSGNAAAATINQLRMAFQIQKLFEKDALSGTRYREILASHFSVRSPDARMMIPEYLGGNRINLRISQVLQTSESGTTPQGYASGTSLTVDNHSDVNKSFVEHGFIIGLMCARYKHSYQQGLAPMWCRQDRLDYYFPVLANIGEQPILNETIYAQGSGVVDSDGNIIDKQVFGYQEAWADYRYKPDYTTGLMRSTASASLDSWHLGDDYAALPSLSSSWLQEDLTNVDRVLSVGSSVTNQIFCDIFIGNKCTRAMPFYSVPGLIDHH